MSKKRKYEADSSKTLMARVVFNDAVAIELFDIPASSVPTEKSLLKVLGKNIGITISSCEEENGTTDLPNHFYGRGLFAPRLLLQETSTRKHSLQHTRWVTIDGENHGNYRGWYERNIEHGSEDNLLVEMRLHIWEKNEHLINQELGALDKLEVCLKIAGEGRASLLPQPFERVFFADLTKPLEYWHSSYQAEPSCDNPMPHTHQLFPFRKIMNPFAADGGCEICRAILREQGLLRLGKKAMKKEKASLRREAEQNDKEKKVKDENTPDDGAAVAGLWAGAGWKGSFAVRTLGP